jgi:hypothetical protein
MKLHSVTGKTAGGAMLGRSRQTKMVKALVPFAIIFVLFPDSRAEADSIGVTTRLHVRLKQSVSSFGSKADERIAAAVIAPVESNGQVLIPLHAEILGHVESVKRVGLGMSHETAAVHLSFDTLRLPDGHVIPLSAQVESLDNARERVDEKGVIRGIRATGSFASRISGMAVSVGILDPMLLGFTMSSSLSLFRIPESEIILPAGTEFVIELLKGLELSHDFGRIAPPLVSTPESRTALATFIESLPFRTATNISNIPSDLTNLVFLGSREAIANAMDAAGWGQTDAPGGHANYAALRAIVEDQGYREAPMSVLLLNGQAPTFTYAKTLDTFFERHHVRIFGPLGMFDGRAAWTASATHDSGIGFATRARTFIHVIDQNIDHEREKVVYDLILTGCVEGLDYIERPWLPTEASNATGDRLRTDRRAAVVRLSPCNNPERADKETDAPERVRPKPSAPERVLRDITLTLKNDAFRGNIVYQGYSGIRSLFTRNTIHRTEAGTRSFRLGGEQFLVVPGAAHQQHELTPEDLRSPKPTFQPVGRPRVGYHSRLEFSFSGGTAFFGNQLFSTQRFDFLVPIPNFGTIDAVATAPSELESGWSIAPKVTFNTSGHLSHEVGYTYNRSRFHAVLAPPLLEPETISAPAAIGQFNYSLIMNMTRNGSRVRPYVAIGPGMQTIRLNMDSRNADRLLNFAFKEVKLFVTAWDLGETPPLEGGGVFQFAVQYGGGVKIHLTPRILIRTDFRQTLSPQPDFWTRSHEALRDLDLPVDLQIEPRRLETHGPLRLNRFSAGVGLSF